MEYPKKKREIDKDYLAYIRKQPCLVLYCPEKTYPHHDPTVKAGGTDYNALPLCTEHHTSGVHLMGRDTFQSEYGIDFNAERVRLLILYIKQLKNE